MSKPTILVVDDDPIMRTLMGKMLRVRGIEVYEAENGQIAQKIFESGKIAFSMIVSDLRMPEMDGLELLKRVRAKSLIPFVVFTGLTRVAESQKAFDLGATEFLTKPVDKEGIQKIVAIFNKENSSRAEAALNAEPGPDDFHEIKIEEFLSTTTLQSDVYIRLSKTRFVKIAKKGELSPRDRLAEYRDKNIKNLYVLVKDFSLYVSFATDLSTKALVAPGISDDAKRGLLQTSSKLMVEHVMSAPEIDKLSLECAQQVVESALKFAADNPAVMEQLTLLSSHSNRLYAHSMAVAFYSALLAREHGWDSETTLNRVALGGLFHDIGKRDIDVNLLHKPRKDLNREEQAIMETHCTRGRDILVNVKGLPEEVALIAMNHHENRLGSGYPRRMKGELISAHVRLIAVVDKLCSLTNPICPTEVGLSSFEAIERMDKFYRDELDPVFFRHLMDICGYKPKLKKPAAS